VRSCRDFSRRLAIRESAFPHSIFVVPQANLSQKDTRNQQRGSQLPRESASHARARLLTTAKKLEV
jgi:hypothetical protein